MDDDDLFDLPDNPLRPHPLIEAEGICGVTMTRGQTEFICIRPIHAKVYPSRRRGFALESNANADRHSFVNRWPNRPRNQEE